MEPLTVLGEKVRQALTKNVSACVIFKRNVVPFAPRFSQQNGLVCIIFLAAGSCFYLHRVPCSWNVILLDSLFFKKAGVAFLSQGT